MEDYLFTNVKGNTKESDVFLWALDAAVDYWCSKDGAELRDGKEYKEIYRVSKKYGYTILAVEEIIDDIIYRLQDQLIKISNDQLQNKETVSNKASARRVVKKLRAVKNKF